MPGGVPSQFQKNDPWPVYIERGSGAQVWDVDGNEYLDFHNGFGVMCVGHANPVIADGCLYAGHGPGGGRDPGVGGGGREHVDHVGAGGDERVEVGKRGRAPPLGAGLGAGGVEIGDADQLDVGRELLDRGDVELADVACADHAGAKPFVAHRAFLWAISATVRVTSDTRADHVSCAIASERARRAAGVASPRAASIAATNDSGVGAIRHRCA